MKFDWNVSLSSVIWLKFCKISMEIKNGYRILNHYSEFRSKYVSHALIFAENCKIDSPKLYSDFAWIDFAVAFGSCAEIASFDFVVDLFSATYLHHLYSHSVAYDRKFHRCRFALMVASALWAFRCCYLIHDSYLARHLNGLVIDAANMKKKPVNLIWIGAHFADNKYAEMKRKKNK